MGNMVVKRWVMLSLSLFFALVSICCSKDEDGRPKPQLPAGVQENTVVIAGTTYALTNGKYHTGMYPYMNKVCTNFYLECANGAGVTVELAEILVGKTVYFERRSTFWFFGIGNGNGIYVPMQHDSEHVVWGNWYKPGEKYSGWFHLTRDTETDYCTLEFMVNKNGVQGWAMGNIKTTFSRLSSL